MDQPILTTERLTLRPFSLSDAKEVQRLAGDRAIADTTLNVPHPYEDGMAEGWIQTHAPKYLLGELVAFAVVEQSSGALVGAVGISISKQFNRGELGYWIGVPYWGQGFCTEASKCLVNFAFSKLGLHRVTAYHLARNPASGRVMEKIGMRKEGLLREHNYRWGKHEDLVAYGILATDQQEACSIRNDRF